jgi:bacterial/archaeal transporter family-2 protein
MALLAFAIALLAGGMISLQTGSNSQLKKSFAEPLTALITNYLFGMLAVIGVTAVRRVSLPSLPQITGAPWWSWFGGLFGACYGLTAIVLASRLGAATLTALVVTGQLVCSVILDHFGWLGFEVHCAGWGRISGCLLMIAGLALISVF